MTSAPKKAAQSCPPRSAAQQVAHEVEQQGIDHEREQAQREDQQRQRQKHQDGPNEGIEDAQHQRGHGGVRRLLSLKRMPGTM